MKEETHFNEGHLRPSDLLVGRVRRGVRRGVTWGQRGRAADTAPGDGGPGGAGLLLPPGVTVQGPLMKWIFIRVPSDRRTDGRTDGRTESC